MSNLPRGKTAEILTPKAPCSWAFLNRPDNYGNYKITVNIPEGEADELVTTLQEVGDSYLTVLKALGTNITGSDGETIRVRLPLDDSEDGLVGIKFKLKSSYTDPKTQKVFPRKPVIVDARKEVFDATEIQIGSGSTVRVNGVARPTYMPGQSGEEPKLYVSLEMKAVQLIEIVDPSRRFAEGFDQEDGYEFTPSDGNPSAYDLQ